MPRKPPPRVVGRLYWDPTHPSPWMTFYSKTEYGKWATAIRKARPGTKTEFEYIDLVWTGDAMLSHVQRQREEMGRSE